MNLLFLWLVDKVRFLINTYGGKYFMVYNISKVIMYYVFGIKTVNSKIDGIIMCDY